MSIIWFLSQSALCMTCLQGICVPLKHFKAKNKLSVWEFLLLPSSCEIRIKNTLLRSASRVVDCSGLLTSNLTVPSRVLESLACDSSTPQLMASELLLVTNTGFSCSCFNHYLGQNKISELIPCGLVFVLFKMDQFGLLVSVFYWCKQ